MDGQPDIVTASDWQNHLSQMRQSFLKARKSFKSLRGQTLDAHPAIYSGASNVDIITTCSTQKTGKNTYEIPNCPYRYAFDVKIARPDFEALSLTFSVLGAGYMPLFTAYSLEGAERVAEKIEKLRDQNGFVPPSKVLAAIRSEPHLLKIRDEKALTDFLNLGSEGMEALNYVLTHQPELCPKDHSDNENRKGYLYAQGFCSNAEAAMAVAQLNAVLSGPTQVVKEALMHSQSGNNAAPVPSMDESTDRYLTEIDLPRVLSHPIGDLKDVLPSVDETTGRYTFADESVGGLFPHRDANTFFNFGLGVKVNTAITTPPLQ
jgi:hypothetical protein